MGISSSIMKSPSPKSYMTFWDITIYNDTLKWSDFTSICKLITELNLLPILTLLPNFGCFHRTLQLVRLANRGRLLLRTPGPVPFGTCICSNVETNLSWTCHVYGPFEFRTSLGTSILPFISRDLISLNRYRGHKTDFEKIPSERPILLPCNVKGCGCRSYSYMPKMGSQPIRCKCKHFSDDHAVRSPHKCKNGE